MRDETKTKLGAALSAFHESDMYSEDADSACAVIHNLLKVADAEALIAAEDGPRFGKFNLLGHSAHVGEVIGRPSSGAYTIRYWTMSSVGDVSQKVMTTEAAGRYSIEWMTDEKHAKWIADLMDRAQRAATRHRRRTTLPDGYETAERDEYLSYGFKSLDGGVHGFWLDGAERNEAAWEHFDGAAVNDEEVVADMDHDPSDGGSEPPF